MKRTILLLLLISAPVGAQTLSDNGLETANYKSVAVLIEGLSTDAVSIDGQPVGGLTDLHERIAAARQDGRPVTLVLKRWSNKRDQFYDYIELTVAIEELYLIWPAHN